MSATLSVVVPAYNCESYIEGCLSSILCGGPSDLPHEVIVIDDGSTDGTVAACERVRDGRLRIISQRNSGVSEARNHGLRVAGGDWVMFVDSDDEVERGWADKVRPFLDSAEDCVIFGSELSAPRVAPDDLVASIVGLAPYPGEKTGNSPIAWASSPFSRIYSRRFLKTGGIEFDASILNGEDALLNLAVFLGTERVLFVDEPIYRYRIHASSATHSYDARFTLSNEIYLRKLENLLGSCGRYPSPVVSSLVDFSFCRSVSLMAIRAARAGDRSARRSAACALAADDVVCSRLAETRDISHNLRYERLVFRLVKSGHVPAAVALARVGLMAKERGGTTPERWVSI